MKYFAIISAALLALGLLAVVLHGRRKPSIRDQFIAELSAAQPDWHLDRTSADVLEVSIPGRDGSITYNLQRLDARFEHERPAGRTEIDEFLKRQLGALKEAAAAGDLSRSIDRTRIYPRIVSAETLGQYQKTIDLPCRKLDETGLAVLYAEDLENSVRFIDRKAARAAELTDDLLHDLALSNLRRSSSGADFRSKAEKRAIVRIALLDSYDAARILLVPETLEPGHSAGVVIPDRDTFLLLHDPAENEWEILRKLAEIPLSDRLITNRPIEVTPHTFRLR